MNTIHRTATISKLADIETSKRGSTLSVGSHSFIDSFVKIKFVGGVENIWIGDNCFINSGCVLYSGNGIKIGNNVLIAANCTLCPINHEFVSNTHLIKDQGFRASKGGIIIEDDIWIGANTVILDGAFIAKGCVIGAGSLVRDTLTPYAVYGGNPLKLIKPR